MYILIVKVKYKSFYLKLRINPQELKIIYIFGDDKSTLLLFCNMMKELCIEIVQNENRIYWEVNVWYLIYRDFPEWFSIYNSNHDESILSKY